MEKVTPTCRYAHGDLKREDGIWALEGVAFTQAQEFFRTNEGMALTVFSCPSCGYTELFEYKDQGGADEHPPV